MRVPSVSIAVDGQQLTGPEAALAALSVWIETGAAVDSAEFAVGWQSPIASIAPGAEVEIALGYDGETTAVLTGDVDRLTQRPWGVQFDVVALPGRLQHLRVGRSYLDQAPSDIVADLAGEAEVPTADLATSGPLPAYFVDERRTAWRHVQDLARLAAAEISTQPDGSLVMKSVSESAGGGLGAAVGEAASALGLSGGGWRFGAELVDAAISPGRVATAPAVEAHGAASPAGRDKWHLLVKEPDGAAPTGLTLVPAAIRDRDAATTFASGLSARGARRGTTARLVVVGKPDVRAGDQVTIEDWPHGAPPPRRVVAVEHQISRRAGFTSRVSLEEAA